MIVKKQKKAKKNQKKIINQNHILHPVLLLVPQMKMKKIKKIL